MNQNIDELELPEYKRFLEYFYEKPFSIDFKFKEKPSLNIVVAAKNLECIYYNSFYIFSLIISFSEDSLIDTDLLYELAGLLFLDEEKALIKDEETIKSLQQVNTIDEIEKNIELLEIKKHIIGLKAIENNETLRKVNFITNNVILYAAMDFKYNFVFMSIFQSKNINLIQHKNIIKKCIQILNTLDLGSFFSDEQIEEDLNNNLDLFQMLLFFVNNYLIKLSTTEKNITNIDALFDVKNNIETTINALALNIEKYIDEIKIEQKDYKFIYDVFESTFYLLTVSQEMDADVFIIFKFCISIHIFVLEKVNFNKQKEILEKVMKCKEFLISEDLMLDLHQHIILCLSQVKNKELSKKHLKIFISTESVVFLNNRNRSLLIQYYYENDVLSARERLGILRIVYYNLKTDYGKGTFSDSKDEYPLSVTTFFLEFISYFTTSSEFIEINNFYKYFLRFEFSLEFYASFLSRNNFDMPLYVFLRSFEEDFIIKFYMIFFKKIRSNYASRSGQCSTNFSLIIDKHIINFCKYFIQEQKNDFISILNAIPFLPPRKGYFYIYFEIWKFVLDNGFEKELLFFAYKTPALIDLASSFTKEEIINEDIVNRVFRKIQNINTGSLFTLKNTRKFITTHILAIIFIVEYEKVRNFNFSGIIEYLSDTILLKSYREELNFIFVGIHYNLKLNYAYAVSYMKSLLLHLLDTYETTKTIILEIMKQIVKNRKDLVYNIEINELFNSNISKYNTMDLNKTESVFFKELFKFYNQEFFDKIRTNTPNIYAYFLFCKFDINLYNDNKVSFKGVYSEAINQALTTFTIIQEFIDTHKEKTNEENDLVNIDKKYFEFADVSWLVDVVYIKKHEIQIVKSAVEILKSRLSNLYSLTDLLSLLKIYNWLEIMEHDAEMFLKESINQKLNMKIVPSVILELTKNTTGFFNFFFVNYYFILTGDHNYAKNSNFPIKESAFQMFTLDELIILHNKFKKKITLEILKKTTQYHFLDFYFTSDNLSTCDIITLLLNCKEKNMISKALQHLKTRDIKFYIPQLVQCLKRKDIFTEIFLVLLEQCKNKFTCHFLLWNLRANLYNNCDTFQRCIKDIENSFKHYKIDDTTNNPENDINSNDFHQNHFFDEMVFFDALTSISNSMMPFLRESKIEKSKEINNCLRRIAVPDGIYLPTDPTYQILKIVDDSGKSLQSHAKIPFMASFFCVKQNLMSGLDLKSINFDLHLREYETHGIEIKNLIFKAGDDCRQDILALQLISLFKEVFNNANLEIFLFPYQVIAIGVDTGIIEVIPDAITRDQMGREKINNLVEYFEYMYGFSESQKYKEAVQNFVISLAGYSLVTYFLNIKDRHNGNIMIDKFGHIIHIDFGYMLEISPGNMNIELSVKLTNEIYELLQLSNNFDRYVDLVVKGFYALRRNSKDIIFLVESFKNSGLPCFKKNATENLMARFKLGLSDDEARTFMISTIVGSIGKIRTWVYDKYQQYTNNIAF